MTYRGHVEATFESAHKADVPGHKCSGTLGGVPDDIRQAIDLVQEESGMSQEIRNMLLNKLHGLFDYHGHSWLAEIDFEYEEVDEHFWGPDFGKVKDLIRTLDHHNLNLFFEQPTAEFISQHLYRAFEAAFGFPPTLVKLHEGRGNTMTYYGK
jgi:6-pyruvoyl-tetrahydropterin synthase